MVTQKWLLGKMKLPGSLIRIKPGIYCIGLWYLGQKFWKQLSRIQKAEWCCDTCCLAVLWEVSLMCGWATWGAVWPSSTVTRLPLQRPSGDACRASVLLGMGGSVLEAEGNAAGWAFCSKNRVHWVVWRQALTVSSASKHLLLPYAGSISPSPCAFVWPSQNNLVSLTWLLSQSKSVIQLFGVIFTSIPAD